MLPVPGRLGACQTDLLAHFAGGHQPFGQGNVVVLQIDHPQLFTHGGVVVDQGAQLADQADHLLGHVVAGGGLRAEDVGLGGELRIGMILQVQVLRGDVQRVQVLALVLVHALDLAVEDGIGVDHLAGGLFQIGGKLGLVGLLHVLQSLENSFVVLVGVQLGKLEASCLKPSPMVSLSSLVRPGLEASSQRR